MAAFPVRDTAFVELVRDAYASCDVSNRVLGVLFSLQPGELADMRRRYRWPRRVHLLLEMTAAEKLAARQAADEARAIALYGSAEAVADVLVLRRRGFVVYRWGTKVMVGGVLVSLKRMREMAARERRLLEANRPVEIMAAQAKASDDMAKDHRFAGGGANPPPAPPTLIEMGIDKNLAPHRARTLATLGAAPVKDHTGQEAPQLLATQGKSAPALVASRASGIHP